MTSFHVQRILASALLLLLPCGAVDVNASHAVNAAPGRSVGAARATAVESNLLKALNTGSSDDEPDDEPADAEDGSDYLRALSRAVVHQIHEDGDGEEDPDADDDAAAGLMLNSRRGDRLHGSLGSRMADKQLGKSGSLRSRLAEKKLGRRAKLEAEYEQLATTTTTTKISKAEEREKKEMGLLILFVMVVLCCCGCVGCVCSGGGILYLLFFTGDSCDSLCPCLGSTSSSADGVTASSMGGGEDKMVSSLNHNPLVPEGTGDFMKNLFDMIPFEGAANLLPGHVPTPTPMEPQKA